VGLDLYAGPLWRLYAGDIERPSQRFGREMGMKVEMVYASGAEPLTKEDAKQAVVALRKLVDRQAMKVLGSTKGISTWNEECDDYFCEQLRAEGIQSIVLMAAYDSRRELTRPTRLPEKINDDPAISEAPTRGYYIGPMAVLEAQLILPSREDFLLVVEEANGRRSVVTSTSNLAMVLQKLRESIWNNQVDVQSWLMRGLAPPDGHVSRRSADGSTLERVPTEPVEDRVKHDAEYAFAVFSEALAFAEAYGAPIRHDA